MPSSYLGAHGNLAVDPVEGADTEEVNLYFLAYGKDQEDKQFKLYKSFVLVKFS